VSSSWRSADDADQTTRENLAESPSGTAPAMTAGAAARPTQMPASVRIAIITMSLLAGLLLLNALLTWFSRATLAKAMATGGTQVTLADAQGLIALVTIVSLVLGLLLALSTWFLPMRRAWARLTGLGASLVLCVMVVFSVIATRGLSIESLLLLVISLAAMFSLLAGNTARWVPRLRARR
jgi:hypothetical protein